MDDVLTCRETKVLTQDEIDRLERQNSRFVSEYKSAQLEINAKKNWDLFYKRNETRFFRDRHWTTREFTELLGGDEEGGDEVKKSLLEIGCGVGNFFYPLLQDGRHFKIFACDISTEAIQLVKSNELFDENVIKPFQCDITDSESVFSALDVDSINIATLIFVLSAIHPDKFEKSLRNIWKVLKPGGCLLFRDYGLYDMAQIRFKAGHKIAENFYMRQDGTRTYYFSIEFMEALIKRIGFEIIDLSYVHRRTINKKENVDVPRVFIQGRFRKQDAA